MLEQPIPLTPQGDHRRNQILRLALQEAHKRRSRRQTIRAGLVCAMLIAALSVGLLLLRTHSITKSIVDRRIHPTPAPSPAPRPHGLLITRIHTEPGISRRLSIRAPVPHWHQLSDDELLRQLAAAGKPAALASIRGRELLLFHHRGDGF